MFCKYLKTYKQIKKKTKDPSLQFGILKKSKKFFSF